MSIANQIVEVDLDAVNSILTTAFSQVKDKQIVSTCNKVILSGGSRSHIRVPLPRPLSVEIQFYTGLCPWAPQFPKLSKQFIESNEKFRELKEKIYEAGRFSTDVEQGYNGYDIYLSISR